MKSHRSLSLCALGGVVALVGLGSAACGADFMSTSGDDAGLEAANGDGGVPSGDGSANDGAASDAPTAEPCSQAGAVRVCKSGSIEGSQTCIEEPDKTLQWGRCISSQCDSSATPDVGEVCVPAGQFTMGGLDGTHGLPLEGDTLPAHPVTVRRRFYFDKFEVSYSELMAWFKPTPTVPADNTLVYVSGSGDELRWHGAMNVKAPGSDVGFGCTSGVVANDASKSAASINCLTWETALAYCMAHGKRLPTEAEWEYVASGLGKNNDYPWGSGAPDGSCTHSIDNDCFQSPGSKFPFVRPSAMQGNTLSGINNLAGNEAEWTLDLAPKTSCASDSSCWPTGTFDPLNVKDNGSGYVLRGGSYVSSADQVRPRARGTYSTQQQGSAGFRCVRDEL